jgi:hypothetical protein
MRFAIASGAVALALSSVAATRITEVTPSVVPLGHETKVDIRVHGATPTTRIALSPGGPFQSAAVPLADALAVTAPPGSDRVLAISAHEVVLLGGGGDPPEVINRAVTDSTLRRAAFSGTTVVLADDRNALLTAHLPDDDHVQLTPRAVLDQPVADLALAGQTAIALLTDGRVLRADLAAAPDVWTPVATIDGGAARLAFDGRHCLVFGADDELRILDCTSGEARELARFRTSGRIHDAAVGDGIAALADGAAGLTLLDLGDPTRPRLAGSYNKLGDARRVALDRDRVLVANDRDELTLLDIARPALPLLVSRLRSARPVRAVALRDDMAWTAGEATLARLDFTAEPASLLSDEGASLGGSRRGFVRNNTLFVADWFSGLHLYDVGDAEVIRHIGNYHSPGSSKGVVVRDRYAFVGDDDHGVQIVDISNPERPVAVKNVPTTGLAYTMKLVDDRLYVADHRGGIHIIDVRDIASAAVIGSFDTPGKAWAIDVRGTTAFVADDSSGLLVFDTADPKRIRQIGQFAPGGLAEDVRLRDRYAYVTFFDEGLFVIDTLDPRAPREVARLAIPGNARGIEFQGQYAYVAAWEAGLQVVDVRDPRRPRIVGYADTDGSAWGVNVSGNYAYVLDWWGGVKRVDIREPARPRLTTQYQASAKIAQVALGGCCAATVDESGSVHIYDVTNGLNPVWINGIDLPGATGAIAWSADTAYAATADGIAVIDMRDPFTARRGNLLPMPWRPAQLRAAAGAIVAVGENGIAARVDAVTGEVRTLATGVRDAWIADQAVYVVRGGLGLAGYSLRGVPLNVKTTWLTPPTAARLLRAGDSVAVVVDGASTLRVVARRENSFSEVAQLDLGTTVRDVALGAGEVYATTAADELLVIDIHDPGRPFLSHRYASAQTVTQIALGNGVALLAGERKPGSVRLLPGIRFAATGGGRFSATLPATLPQGAYDITVSDGDQTLPGLNNAVRVSIKTGRKPAISPERFQELLEQQRR